MFVRRGEGLPYWLASVACKRVNSAIALNKTPNFTHQTHGLEEMG